MLQILHVLDTGIVDLGAGYSADSDRNVHDVLGSFLSQYDDFFKYVRRSGLRCGRAANRQAEDCARYK